MTNLCCFLADLLYELDGRFDVGVPLAEASTHVRDLCRLEAQSELEERVRDWRNRDVNIRHASL